MKPQTSFKGAKNYLFHSANLFDFLSSEFRMILTKNHFTPSFCSVIDPKILYQNSLGTSTDIVQKEMFTLDNQDFVLRPEGTANLLNAFTHEFDKSKNPFPFKKYYVGPMFRHEKPQFGRYRQFWQLGVEILNNKYELGNDLELILVAEQILSELNLRKKVSLTLNNIGDNLDRTGFSNYIKEYFNSRPVMRKMLSADSLLRLETNPLRILDSKNETDLLIAKDLRPISEFVSSDSTATFKNLTRSLLALGIQFEVCDTLVRGLDYYNDFCFEYLISDKMGQSQNTALAGGRYDKLYAKMPEKIRPVFGTGFALGIDRIIDHFENELTVLMNQQQKLETLKLGFVIIQEDNSQLEKYLEVFRSLKTEKLVNFSFDLIFANKSSFAKKFDYFLKKGITKCIIVGSNETAQGSLILRDLNKRKQTTILLENISEKIIDELNLFLCN